MYDPDVVDTFVRVYRDIDVVIDDAPEHREVMQRLTQSRHDSGAVARPRSGSQRHGAG